MSVSEKKLTANDLLKSSFLGVVRAVSVHTLIHPLEVVKVRFQNAKSETMLKITENLFQEHGFKGFYKGFNAQILKIGVKQVWCWPLILHLPDRINNTSFNELQKQALTGFCIASIDALISTPIEKAKMLAIVSKNKDGFSDHLFHKIYKGFFFHWMKLSVCWMTFLTTQKHLRTQKRFNKEKLSLQDLGEIGIKTAFVVSFVAAPFDLLSTLGFLGSSKVQNIPFKSKFKISYRAFPISFTALSIQNIASIYLIDRGCT